MAWPTTTDPRTEFITLRLTPSEAADLDLYRADKNFKSRSAAVRDCVERCITAEKRRKKKARGENG